MFTAFAALPPAMERGREKSEVDEGVKWGENPYFPLPKGCRRILILSNVQGGFPMPALQDGDCIVHLNRAVHFRAAREAGLKREAVMHVLFARCEDAGEGKFFWPEDVEGFQAALTIRANMYRQMPFFAEYQQEGGNNPTSGFIVANVLRYYHPRVPILLVGFAPQLDLTYRAPIHQWRVEAEWYAQGKGGFLVVPPACSMPADVEAAPALLRLLICSCAGHEAQRAACRETWLAKLPQGVTYRFFMGGDTAPVDEPDVMYLPGVDDSFAKLPAKVIAAFREASKDPGWNWLGKIDDDSYLRVERLMPWLRPQAAIVGRKRLANYCPGGAGYFLRRDAVVSLLARADELPEEGAEDKLICQHVSGMGYSITDCPLLLQYRKEGVLDPSNDFASSHHLTPEMMRSIAARFAEAPAIAGAPLPDPRVDAVHQVWIGEGMPADERAWTEAIRRAARRAGWAYTLWGWEALRERFAEHAAMPMLRRLMELAPGPQVYGVLCDYFRFALLAQESEAGVFYLDTDFSISGGWPEFPQAPAIHVMVEVDNIAKRCPGALWRPKGVSHKPFVDALELMVKRLDAVFGKAETREDVLAICNEVKVQRILGPMYQRAYVYRDWERQKVAVNVFQPTFISHSAWRTRSRFVHHSLARWNQ